MVIDILVARSARGHQIHIHLLSLGVLVQPVSHILSLVLDLATDHFFGLFIDPWLFKAKRLSD